MKYMAYGQTEARTHNQKSSVSGTKSKIIAGAIGIAAIAGGAGYVINDAIQPADITSPEPVYSISYYKLRKTKQALASLTVRADDEAPTEFNSNNYVPTGWSDTNDSGCDTRYDVLFSTLSKAKQGNTKCKIQSGELFDYYTGEMITDTAKIHIDHVVSKKNAWDSGGYQWDADTWEEYVNDEERVLLAVSAKANQEKGPKDAADWLPSNEDYWCKYIIQQIEIKTYYGLSLRQVEKDKMNEVLTNNCKTK